MRAILLLTIVFLAGAAQAAQTITAKVNGMVCAFCAQGIEKKARSLPQTEDVYVNLKQKIVAIQLKEGQQLSTDAVSQLVKDAGYDVSEISVGDESIAAIKARTEQQ